MSKTLRKAIMKRSKLRNTFNKKRSSENWQNYKRQRNICSNILKSTKKTFFETLNINEITGNRKFWKTVKPFFTDKCKTTNNIILTEKNETLNNNKKIPTPFIRIVYLKQQNNVIRCFYILKFENNLFSNIRSMGIVSTAEKIKVKNFVPVKISFFYVRTEQLQQSSINSNFFTLLSFLKDEHYRSILAE